jgi:nicotinate-nucleotide--dimethylbenzimidazole phosphoribosyltransferase
MSDLLQQTIGSIKPLDKEAMSRAKERQDSLTKPAGSLGRLEEIAIQIAGIQGKAIPQIKGKAVIVMAADHGVVARGTSAYPQEVTPQMVLNFLRGGAAINVISRRVGARVVIVDMGVAGEITPHKGLISRKIAAGTQDMGRGPAMSLEQANQAVETGIEIVQGEISRGLDIVATGDMGIGNTTASAAICAVMTGKTAAVVTGRGTGIDDKQLSHKIAVIDEAIALNRPQADKPLEVLAKVGGFEIGGLAGVMLGAASRKIPVVIDGFISGAAALIAVGLCPQVKDYLIAGHCSVEPGHRLLLNKLGLKPIVDLEMRLGEGTGAALGIFVAETAVHVLAEMATFAEAGVSEKEGGN